MKGQDKMLQEAKPYPYTPAGIQGQAMPKREQNPDCIELTLNAVEIELGEALNSSSNLADKLRGCPLKGESQPSNPVPSDVQSRIQAILNSVRMLNQNLGNSHNAISG